MAAKDARDPRFLHEIVETQFRVGSKAPGISIDLAVVATKLGRTGHIRTAVVRVNRTINEMRVDIDTQRIGAAAVKQRLLPILVALHIVHEVQAETVVKESLRQIDIIGIPILPLTLVVTIDQLLIEIEDRGIGERLGAVIARAITIIGIGLVRKLAEIGLVAGNRKRTGEEQSIDRAIDRPRRIDAEVIGRHRRHVTHRLISVNISVVANGARPILATDRDTIGIRNELVGIGVRALRAGIERHLVHVAEPEADIILGSQGTRAVSPDTTVLEVSQDLGNPTLDQLRLETDRPKDTGRALKRGILLKLLIIVQTSDTNRQSLADNDLIYINGIAQRAPVIHLVLKGVSRGEGRLIHARVDDTSRRTDTKQHRIGTTLNIDAIDDIAIPGNLRHEEVARIIG
ncbi:MAG: hypothetical protein BWX86_01354 [Verrucomicrobia bacterium ADurb.Bin122]|nr:MAG: hypothetical protein BWX86_01354 [Verrucomicrobia bacterium ADurb.Bin122]